MSSVGICIKTKMCSFSIVEYNWKRFHEMSVFEFLIKEIDFLKCLNLPLENEKKRKCFIQTLKIDDLVTQSPQRLKIHLLKHVTFWLNVILPKLLDKVPRKLTHVNASNSVQLQWQMFRCSSVITINRLILTKYEKNVIFEITIYNLSSRLLNDVQFFVDLTLKVIYIFNLMEWMVLDRVD